MKKTHFSFIVVYVTQDAEPTTEGYFERQTHRNKKYPPFPEYTDKLCWSSFNST